MGLASFPINCMTVGKASALMLTVDLNHGQVYLEAWINKDIKCRHSFVYNTLVSWSPETSLLSKPPDIYLQF